MNTDYLDSILQSSIKQLDEKTFVTRYLPLLFDKDPSLFNMLWLNHVAENPHVRVNIVDTKNNVLFSVPPLRASHSAKVVENIAFTLSNATNELEVKGAKGARDFSNLLPLLIRFEKLVDPEHQEEWRQILIRYNLEDKLPKVDSVSVKKETLDFSDSDDGW